jgi:hydroxypyruvate isomerase
MTKYSACIEWLFEKEAPDFADRIRAARAAGIYGIEFWDASSKDLDAIKAALDETGLTMVGILTAPMQQITNPQTHAAFLQSVRSSLANALKLGAQAMIVTTGDERHDVPREVQHAAIVKVLKDAADIVKGSGVVLALEPLNDRVDHPGYYLTSTVEGLDIVDEVDRPDVRLLYDIYHSAMMGEHTEDVLEGRLDRVAHVHLADTQGRGEPGSGTMDWRARLDWLADHGYEGFVGLEYRPTGSTEDSLSFMR